MEVLITGCKGFVEPHIFLNTLKEFSLQHQAAAQAFYAPFIYGKEHIVTAVEHAIRAFRNQTQTCRSLDMEILLYAAGRRQIRDAIDTLGIKLGEPMVVAAVTDDELLGCDGFIGMETLTQFLIDQGLQIDHMVIPGDDRVLQPFGVTPAEQKTVDKSMYGDLIMERVALVDLIT